MRCPRPFGAFGDFAGACPGSPAPSLPPHQVAKIETEMLLASTVAAALEARHKAGGERIPFPRASPDPQPLCHLRARIRGSKASSVVCVGLGFHCYLVRRVCLKPFYRGIQANFFSECQSPPVSCFGWCAFIANPSLFLKGCPRPLPGSTTSATRAGPPSPPTGRSPSPLSDEKRGGGGNNPTITRKCGYNLPLHRCPHGLLKVAENVMVEKLGQKNGLASAGPMFDADYCYALGLTAGGLISNGLCSVMACVNNLLSPVAPGPAPPRSSHCLPPTAFQELVWMGIGEEGRGGGCPSLW